MRFLSAAHTDVGIKKKINQDAFCLKVAVTPSENILFAVLCDGMGGLKMGELASAFLVNAFSRWFESSFPEILKMNGNTQISKIKEQWNNLIVKQNSLIGDFGEKQGFSLGTTASVLLIYNNKYILTHVGDSRIYKINSEITQLTEDQTLVAFEVKNNKITAAQAKEDSRKNILLQCIGASKTVVPDFKFGEIAENDMFMLCSDGFRHEVSEEEFYGILAPDIMTSERVIKKSLIDLVDLNKKRGEVDNITAIAIKCIK